MFKLLFKKIIFAITFFLLANFSAFNYLPFLVLM